MFDDVCLMITGGTGSFGNAVVRRFLDSNVREIRIFSRDEKKQDDMRKLYRSDKIKFFLGDVRSRDSLSDAMHGVDFVFHAAALKQVPSCEFFPLEAVHTNVLGTANTIDAAHRSGVKRMICLSTDKAVYPINAMGTSKAMMEKVATGKARAIDPDRMTICCTRYGNVMASRGSVIPLFVRQIQAGEPRRCWSCLTSPIIRSTFSAPAMARRSTKPCSRARNWRNRSIWANITAFPPTCAT